MNNLRKAAVSAALLGAAVTGGAVGATLLGTASAQTSNPSTSAPSAQPPSNGAAPSAQPPANGAAPSGPRGAGQGAPSGPHQANGKTETPLTGDDLAKVTSAVSAKVPGATIDRAETDADGDTYEAHITKADGTRATVKFDASFNVTSVADGMR